MLDLPVYLSTCLSVCLSIYCMCYLHAWLIDLRVCLSLLPRVIVSDLVC